MQRHYYASLREPAQPSARPDRSSAAISAASGTGLVIVVLAAGGLAWRRSITRPYRAKRA